MNVKFCQGYRKYNTDIPHYLVNRPRVLVSHCIDRMFAADDIQRYHIQCVDDIRGIFKIKSQSLDGTVYCLSFGDANTICKCECLDWQKWWLPCKHFIAIFAHYPDWQWEKLSPLYRDSPYFSLDEELLNHLQYDPEDDAILPGRVTSTEDSCAAQVKVDSSDDATNTNEENESPMLPLPLKKKYHRSTAANCRELLAQLKSDTFLVHSQEALADLKETLSQALPSLRSHIRNENGIKLEQRDTAPCLKRKLSSETQFYNLPRQPKRGKFSGRHGQAANEKKRLTGIKAGINEVPSQLLWPKLHSATPGDNDVDMDVPVKSNSDGGEEKGEASDDVTVDSENDLSEDGEVDVGDEKEEKEKNDGTTGKEDDVEILKVTQGTGQIIKHKKRKMDPQEESTIANGEMLTDVSINVSQNMLHNQFPLCEGLEDTSLGTTFQYSVSGGEFAQIIHTGQCHWVAASNIGCRKGEVNVYDSLNYGTLTTYTVKQIATILHAEDPEIVLNIKPVQQQNNGTDCGVFAIAFVASLLNGQDPSTASYNNNQLRTHLLWCIKNGHLSPFPKAPDQTRLKRCKGKRVITELFCSCRMPWDKQDGKRRATQMACCDKCEEWFHRACENIPDRVFKKMSQWKCSNCVHAS